MKFLLDQDVYAVTGRFLAALGEACAMTGWQVPIDKPAGFDIIPPWQAEPKTNSPSLSQPR